MRVITGLLGILCVVMVTACAANFGPLEGPDAGNGGSVDGNTVDMPPPSDTAMTMDAGACVENESCECDPGYIGTQICGNHPGCRCTQKSPDAGRADISAMPPDGGLHVCNEGETRCGTGCANTQADINNCGTCGHVCPSGQVCSVGTCVVSCSAGAVNCGGNCVDIGLNPANCGGCGLVCNLANASAACSFGHCLISACRAGFASCDENAINGCETNIQTDALNCGACGTRCSFANASAVCTGGSCGLGACAAGFADCDGLPSNGCEVNLTTDATHCGACSTNCGAGSTCSASACVLNCTGGTTNCTGVCVDTRTTVAHCGACGRSCPVRVNTSMNCNAGTCSYTCLPSFAAADGNPANGCSINLMTDRVNCGARGNTCPATVANGIVSCESGMCRVACRDSNFLDLDGLVANGCEVDTRTNRNHCGARGNACTTGMSCCGGVCTNIDRDQYNCGACGTPCTNGNACVSGYCTGTCRATDMICGTSCTNLQADINNCGTCGRACNAANGYASCSSGTCGLTTCYGGYGNCDGVVSNGCEVNLNTDTRNCGACGRSCVAGPNSSALCGYYGCYLACAAGFADCDGVASNGCEVNLNTDPTHCRSCYIACRAGETCDGIGGCTPSCTSPRALCGSTCVDQRTDISHCGSCTNVCVTGLANVATTCAASSCRYTCSVGFADCDSNIETGCETPTTTTTNCGVCGNRCSAGQSCVAGVCTCSTGQTLCGGTCINALTDATNCGGCGRTCTSGQTCSAGTCVGSTPVDAGSADSGVDASVDTGSTDGGTTGAIICPTGTHARTIVFRLPATIPAECGTTAPVYGRPVYWGRSTTDRTRIGTASDVNVTPSTIPMFSVPFPASGASVTSLPLRFTNTAAWPAGVIFRMSGRCNNIEETYYEGFGYWERFPTLAAAGGSFLIDGVEYADQVRYEAVTGQMAIIMRLEPCISN